MEGVCTKSHLFGPAQIRPTALPNPSYEHKEQMQGWGGGCCTQLLSCMNSGIAASRMIELDVNCTFSTPLCLSIRQRTFMANSIYGYLPSSSSSWRWTLHFSLRNLRADFSCIGHLSYLSYMKLHVSDTSDSDWILILREWQLIGESLLPSTS